MIGTGRDYRSPLEGEHVLALRARRGVKRESFFEPPSLALPLKGGGEGKMPCLPIHEKYSRGGTA